MTETEPPGERASSLVADYDLGPFFDEMFEAPRRPRRHYRALNERLGALTDDGLRERIRTANAFFLTQGIGFTVYGDDEGTDRIFPFDLVPRIVPAEEWAEVERGLGQRVRALNLFLTDLYGPQRILAEVSSRWSSSSAPGTSAGRRSASSPPAGFTRTSPAST